jgi:transposase
MNADLNGAINILLFSQKDGLLSRSNQAPVIVRGDR